MHGLDLLGEAVQGADGAQAHGGIGGPDPGGQICIAHACQSGLTGRDLSTQTDTTDRVSPD
ncbi:hypothetical protein GCM10027610_045300 [Dactylosporangium cerinum]